MSIRRIPLAVALAILMPARTSAAGTRVVYIDEVAVFGGADAARARALVDATLTRGGLRAQFAELATEPCGNDPACLMTRTRSAGAVIGLRFTVAEIAGAFVVGVLIVDLERHDTRRELVEGVDLTRADNRLVGALQLRSDDRGPPRYAAWSLAIGAGALAIAGGVTTWRARDLRAEFFAQHVASNGDVMGISLSDARASEQRAQRWSLIAGILFAAAVTSGFGATVLFVRDGGGGLAITGPL